MVAAVLAVVSQTLKPRQEANEKAETISQILTAAQFGEKSSWTDNTATINFYKENIASAAVICAEGYSVKELNVEDAEVYSVSDLKAQNYNIKDGAELALPVYVFKNGVTVLPIYGAGLWGPVWGYIALKEDLETIAGAYFDHASETPGLGGKIKDDPAFRAQFNGKKVLYADGEKPFNIVKGSAGDMENGIDAITGATMTSKGVDAAINQWLGAYKSYVLSQKAVTREPQGDVMPLCDSTAVSPVEPVNE